MSDSIRALVLSRAHHCLLVRAEDGFRVPETTGPWADHPLAALEEHVRGTLGLALPSPAGSRVPADGRGPRDFLFVVDAEAGPRAPATPADAPVLWAPLPRALELTATSGHDRWIWEMYVDRMLAGWEPPVRDVDVFFFGNAGEMAAKLAHLVVSGDKRGTAGWLRAARVDGSTIPRPGMVSIVTDGFGYARCAIQTEDVQVLRFADVDDAVARLEGEGDLTLPDWRAGHLSFFTREGEGMGLAFEEGEEIFVERFRVLRVIGRSDEGR